KLVVAGGSGFLGAPLVRRFIARGDDVTVLSRDPSKIKAGRGVQWDGQTAGAWTSEIDACDVVVNLAGENVGAGRWTAQRKKRLISSRVDSTNAIVNALANAPRKKRTLFNASAVGYYGISRDTPVDESASKGSGFLADLVEQWETAAKRAEGVARVVIGRFG